MPQCNRLFKVISRSRKAAWFARGNTSYLAESIGFDHIRQKSTGDPGRDVRRIQDAFARSAEKARTAIRNDLNLSDQDQAILEAHLMYLKDQGFINKIIHHIQGGCAAEYALKIVVSDLVSAFKQVEDVYLSQRAADIEHIGKQVFQHLIGATKSSKKNFHTLRFWWQPISLR